MLKAQEAKKRMKQELEELETKARFWKAEYEIRYYTLQADQLQPEYDKWLAKQQEIREQLQKDLLEQQAKNIQAGLVPEEKLEEVENA